MKAGNPSAQVMPVFFYYLTMFSFFELDLLPTKNDEKITNFFLCKRYQENIHLSSPFSSCSHRRRHQSEDALEVLLLLLESLSETGVLPERISGPVEDPMDGVPLQQLPPLPMGMMRVTWKLCPGRASPSRTN